MTITGSSLLVKTHSAISCSSFLFRRLGFVLVGLMLSCSVALFVMGKRAELSGMLMVVGTGMRSVFVLRLLEFYQLNLCGTKILQLIKQASTY